MQSYNTLAGAAEATVVEKKSQFIAAAAPVATEEEALAFLEQRRAAHRTASHNVYAYALRENARQRYSDDGEPAKTAGLPVLGVLTHAEVVDAVMVVTRYFGGTLLGTGGLVRAYTAAAQAALAAAGVAVVQRLVTVTFFVEYPMFEQARRLAQEAGATLAQPLFAERVQLAATLPSGGEAALLAGLEELCRGAPQAEVSAPFYGPGAKA